MKARFRRGLDPRPWPRAPSPRLAGDTIVVHGVNREMRAAEDRDRWRGFRAYGWRAVGTELEALAWMAKKTSSDLRIRAASWIMFQAASTASDGDTGGA